MNTNLLPRVLLRSAALLGLAAGLGLTAAEKAPVYDNYFTLSVGGATSDKGDLPAFQRVQQHRQSGYGGIEDLYYSTDLTNAVNLVLKGHALFRDNDFLVDLRLAKEDVGYVNVGYKEFRTYYDGSGNFFQPNGQFFENFDTDLHLDRSNLWLEAGYTAPDKINFTVRYDYTQRDGQKDSLAWADSNLTGGLGSRRISPSRWRINEDRHIIQGRIFQDTEKLNWEIVGRYEDGDQDNRRDVRRRPLEAGTDRSVTHREGQAIDLYNLRGSVQSQLTDTLRLATSVSRTKIDTNLEGSRIYGPDYDSVWDPVWANRQFRDEGFFDLTGETEMKQTIGTVSALFTPGKHWVIAPSFRAEKITWGNHADFEETNFSSARVAIVEEVLATSDKEWKNYSETLEIRYNGIQNITLNAKAEWLNADGDLTEQRILEPGLPAQAIAIDRDTEFDRSSQKYSFTANWYARPGLTLAGQFYYKGRENDYSSPRDNTNNAITSPDRFPAFITNQDFETYDFNGRLSWRINPKLRSVTRYDYQRNTIDSQDFGLGFGESGEMKTHILAQTLTYNPTINWYVTANYNRVWDVLRTPSTQLTGNAAGIVLNSDNNYYNYSIITGFAPDDQDDLVFQYNFYKADNFVDNSRRSVAYGAGVSTYELSATWTRRFSARLATTVKYGFTESDDVTFGGKNGYRAHVVYAKMQYRF